MSKNVYAMLLVAITAAGSGCAKHYGPMASHTINVAEDKQQDILWISENGRQPMRCHDSPKGPVCISAQMR